MLLPFFIATQATLYCTVYGIKDMPTLMHTLIFYFDLVFALCSSLNPVLYGYLDENFKRCFREFCTPSPSVLEMQNSSRTGVTSRKLQQREHNSANTGERSNQQVLSVCVYIYQYVYFMKVKYFSKFKSFRFNFRYITIGRN